MSASLIAAQAAAHEVRTDADPGLQPLGPLTTATAVPVPSVAGRVLSGTSALGLGTMIERGAGFVANVLAARIGGTATFGAYSLAISTANNISMYAAGGIGATAARFSGKYPCGSANYSNLAKALMIVSAVSAALAASALWFGAGPIASLLGKPALATLLHWAVLSAAGIILLECARGFFVGQRLLVALVLLSVIVGSGMIVLLPAAAHLHDPTRMIVLQGSITTTAVVVCLLFSKKLGLHGPGVVHSGATPLPKMLREVWTFGLVQLAGLVGSSLAGWWLTALVARTDTSLVQMSFFSIASQLRNIVGIAPGLLTEGSYAVMADPAGEETRTPHRVMAMCSYASLSVSLMLAAAGIVVVPWALTLVYGRAYSPAALTVAVGLAIAVVHMGNAPAAARLTIVSIRATGVINTIWAVFVAAAATLFLFFGGGAWQAMLIYFLGHILSSALVLVTLHRMDTIPEGLAGISGFGTASVGTLLGLAFVRAFRPELTLPITLAMAAITALVFFALYQFGRHYQWLPSRAVAMSLVRRVLDRVPFLNRTGARHV